MKPNQAETSGIMPQRGDVERRCRASIVSMALMMLVLGLAGCRSLAPSSMMANSLGGVVKGMRQHPDPELVREGSATLLLLIDGLLAKTPDNPDLLLTGAAGYTTYCQAFLTNEEDQPRAALLYERAKANGLRILSQRRAFAAALGAGQDTFEDALQHFTRSDVPAIYWTAAAWLGSILSQPDSMRALAELPKALALMKRVLELNETYEHGSAHLAMGIYYAVQPPGAGRDLDRSGKHFNRARDLAGPARLSPAVLLAEFYATAAGDTQLFLRTLTAVTETNINELPNDDALANSVAQRRAQWLLDNRGDYFLELDDDTGDDQ
ncbi:MAG: hypothetical protein HN742_16995 [Lentisphaerae bacterium]|nr:hypothetical protein [Lentisphaerota bacterium]MBT4816035.1 hypothetical protein [Lentisphaerota bacterium]MBT5606859.1 hypothetical protein [Lentisphaerota bacterium]MBT7059006.1 hypothetical protein [Lentisphaerota bacterium]MBT7843578.1 hypothetical protein [Lentisphaerota bacterium]